MFILGLAILDPRIKSLFWQATFFTLAHTITLLLTTTGWIHPNVAVVEPLIAFSIVFVAIENLFVRSVGKWRYLIVFLFGLIHGMGFAQNFQLTSADRSSFVVSLLSFNAGVELGQITVIAAFYLLIGKWYSTEPWYRKYIVVPLSLLIAGVAIWWTVARVI